MEKQSFGADNYIYTVDADPTITAVDARAGDLIAYNGKVYEKLDDGATTNVSMMINADLHNTTNGYALYLDSSTDVSAQSFPSDSAQQLTNDKFTAVEELPNGASSFWDSTDNKFTPDQANAIYAFTVQFLADPAASDKSVTCRSFVKDGLGPGVDLNVDLRTIRLSKDAASPPEPVGFAFTTGLGVNSVSIGVEVELTFNDTTADVYQVVCVLNKLNGPL